MGLEERPLQVQMCYYKLGQVRITLYIVRVIKSLAKIQM